MLVNYKITTGSRTVKSNWFRQNVGYDYIPRVMTMLNERFNTYPFSKLVISLDNARWVREEIKFTEKISPLPLRTVLPTFIFFF